MGIVGVVFIQKNYLIIFSVLGLAFFLQFYRWKSKGYISLDKKYLSKHHNWPKKLEIEKINGIRYYVDNLTVLADKRCVSIDKEFISEKDFEMLEQQIKGIVEKNKAELAYN